MKMHAMSDAQFAAYSRAAECNLEIDAHRARKTLERHAPLILEHRPKSRSLYPARVLAIAAQALEIAEDAQADDLTAAFVARHLLAAAGIELDEFSP
jgi:hypothetical protein